MGASVGERRSAGSTTERLVVNAAGVAQGIVLVTFPAASTIFTNPADYDLSSTRYGTLFLPQVLMAIATSLLGGRLARRYSTKTVYLAGLLAGLVSMLLLIISSTVMSDRSLAYALLLLATACLGAGFGLTVPALNTFAAAFHRDNVDRAVLVLNALLGVGTVLAPLFVALFVALGSWRGLPVTSAAILVVLALVSRRLPLAVGTEGRASAVQGRSAAHADPATGPGQQSGGIPARFWIYAAFAVLYGVCETMNGNWAELDMTSGLGASTTLASLALTAFWAMVTLGRVLFASLERWVPSRVAYHVLPFVLAGAFVLIASLAHGDGALGLVAFALAGLGCSALLPLTISFAQEELVALSAAAAGGIIGFYQVGYGIAAFGVGPLLSGGAALHSLYAAAAAVALAMGALSFAVARRRPSPASLHPRLGHAA
jgi:MFS family permease